MIDRNLPEYQEAKWRVKIGHAFLEKMYDIEGVMHVGTNDGYEFQFYRQLGIEYFMGFEPLPLAIDAFRKHYTYLADGKEFFFPFALSDKDAEAVLGQTTGDGQGSSFLETTKDYKAVHEEYEYIAKIPVAQRRFDTFYEATKPLIPLEHFDCLVCDVQGLELNVLKGMGKYLDGFKYLNIECSEQPVYEGGAAGHEIVDYLDKHGFRQDTPMEIHNDVFFVRKDQPVRPAAIV